MSDDDTTMERPEQAGGGDGPDINDALKAAMGADDDGSDHPTVDESVSRLIGHLADENELDLFTELSMREIRHLSALSIADDEVTREFVDSYIRLRVSRKRRGRKELVELARALGALRDMAEQGAGGIGASLRGLVGGR